jgi:hypothetical protein
MTVDTRYKLGRLDLRDRDAAMRLGGEREDDTGELADRSKHVGAVLHACCDKADQL